MAKSVAGTQNDVIKRLAAKRDRLLVERAEIRAKAAELSARDRYIDRELADCEAAARVFGVELPRPDPEEEISAGELQKRTMPKVRDIVLDCLRLAGEKGSKAAPIQQYIENTYSTKIHDKTVGMTLYRLWKAGVVRRQGHTWFFVM